MDLPKVSLDVLLTQTNVSMRCGSAACSKKSKYVTFCKEEVELKDGLAKLERYTRRGKEEKLKRRRSCRVIATKLRERKVHGCIL